MAPSRLEVSDHAQDRLKLRKITRKHVRDCIHNGVLVGTDIKGRKVNEKKIGNKVLVVIYIDIVGGAMVVTSYWKGTL